MPIWLGASPPCCFDLSLAVINIFVCSLTPFKEASALRVVSEGCLMSSSLILYAYEAWFYLVLCYVTELPVYNVCPVLKSISSFIKSLLVSALSWTTMLSLHDSLPSKSALRVADWMLIGILVKILWSKGEGLALVTFGDFPIWLRIRPLFRSVEFEAYEMDPYIKCSSSEFVS